MAATLTPNAAFTEAKIFIRQMPLEDVQYRILDDANKRIWMADGWRWTLGTLTNNVTLIDDTQDYPVTLPGNFLYPWRAYATNGNEAKVLKADQAYPASEVLGTGIPTNFCRVEGSDILRFYPKVGNLGGETWTASIWFKKTAPNITVANAGTAGALVMDDEWFYVYFEMVLYYALKYAFDSRAGGAQWDAQSKQLVYTGQLAVAMAAINEMRAREPLFTEWDNYQETEARKK